MKQLLGVLLIALCGFVHAEERVNVCFNYGCMSEQTVRLSEQQLASLKRRLQAASSPLLERKILAGVVGQLYAWAGKQSPIYADRGGNMNDEGVRGGMDCIDHSTTTTRFLHMLARRGWLRFHQVDEVARRVRVLIFEHYSATISLKSFGAFPSLKMLGNRALPDQDEATRFVVDSWFVNNGEAAVILPLDDWMDGGGPDVEPD